MKGKVIPHNPSCRCFRCSGVAWNKGIKTGPNPKHSKRMLGHIPWNKGLKGFMAGEKHWAFGKTRPEIAKENHWFWKGGIRVDQQKGYDYLHKWVTSELGRAMFCDNCKTTTAKRYEWANKSGDYLKKTTDWLRLCKKCHVQYDRRVYVY